MISPTKRLTIFAGFLAICFWVMISAAIVAKIFFMGRYYIPQNGMYPTLPAGSHILTAKRAYSKSSDVKRGDIIVFIREVNGLRYNYIWRVIALPGERVEASGESLVINGDAVQRQQIRESDNKVIYREEMGDTSYEIAFDKVPASHAPDVSIVVPADEFFVMGDNRFNAVDSRYFGPIPFASIIGRKLSWP